MDSCRAILLGAITALVAACAVGPQGAPNGRPVADLIITQTTVINGPGSDVLENVDIVVSDGRIVAVDDHPARWDAPTRIDGSNRFVVPGYIDGHTHPFPVERSFAQFVQYGVTSILVTGCSQCSNETLRELRSLGNDARKAAPRVFHTSQHLTMEGRHPVKTYPSPNWVEGRSVYYLRDVSDVAGIVAQIADQPVVGIKLTIEEGPTPPFVERMPQALVSEVVSRAHAGGLRVYAHVSDNEELRMAHNAGVDHLLHFTGVDLNLDQHRQLLADFVARDVHWVTTLMIDKSFLYPLRPAWIDAARATGLFDRELHQATTFGPSKEAAKRNAAILYGESDPTFDANPILQKQFADLRLLHDAGIALVTGTDVGNNYVLPGYSLHEEMALLAQAGFAPLEILEMTTRNAAALLGEADNLGTVAPGKLADLVLLHRDPRHSVAHLAAIAMVVKGGHVLPRPAAPGANPPGN